MQALPHKDPGPMPAATRHSTARSAERTAPRHGSAAHRSHRDVVHRLRRATGHLQTIVGMIDEGRECVDIAQQLHAVVRALEAAKATLIHDHIDHCLEDAIGPASRDQRVTIEEFRRISRYL